jgi:hypothetical protein
LRQWRRLVCLPLMTLLPVSLLGDDAAAMLRSSGAGVFVNRNPVPASIALFPNDEIETQKNVVARIEASGSAAELSPETMVQFQSDELVLDHGTLAVTTTHGMKVRVGCITVTPVNASDWTDYRVTDVSGKVTVSANKKDVYIEAHSKNIQPAKQPEKSNREIVHESEQKSREEKCAAADVRAPGINPILNSPEAIIAGAAAVVALTCWALCDMNNNPVSPVKPKN